MPDSEVLAFSVVRGEKVVDVVVPWRDRAEIASALPSIERAAAAVGGRVTVVDYGGRPGYLKERLAFAGCSAGVVEVRNVPFFNKAAANNVGASRGNAPLLFFCDCDVILDTSALTELSEIVQQDRNLFATMAGVRETDRNSRRAAHVVRFGYELHIHTANGRRVEIVDHEEDSRDGSRHAPGLLMVRRYSFLEINGYNSRLDGWGWEDQDMICRLTLGLGLQRRMHGTALHISHGDRARMAAYPYDNRWECRDRMFRRALSLYDDGAFQGSYRQDASQAHVAAPGDTVGTAAR